MTESTLRAPSRTRPFPKPLLALTLLMLAAVLPAPAQEDVTLTLVGSAMMHGPDDEVRADLDFEFQLDADGRWDREVWAFGMNYVREGHYERSIGKMDNRGEILTLETDGDTVRLDVAMRFMGHPHIGEGMGPRRWGRYRIEVTRDGDTFRGSYQGLFHGWPVAGEVSGRATPPFVRTIDGVTPPAPGEHPRLMFRRDDLPVLRDRARNTPEGRAMLARLRERLEGDISWGNSRIPARFAAGYGVLYQITGEAEAAERAREIVARIMAGEGQHGRMLQRAPRVMATALAYDLCYEAWDEPFRRRAAAWVEHAAWDVLNMGGGGGLNDHPHSNWMGLAFGSAGVAAMAVLGDPVDFPDPPAAPPHARLAPPQDFEPGPGVPVADHEPGTMPREWLLVGPFDTAAGDDFLAGIGGRAAARPRRGQEVRFGDVTRTWELSTAFENDMLWQHDHFTGPQPALDTLVPIRRAYFSTSYYYLALRNRTPGWFRFHSGTRAGGDTAVLYLAGLRLLPGDVVHLGEGLYPVMIEIAVGSTEPWGKILLQPRFEPLTEEQAAQHKAVAEAEYLRDLREWQAGRDAWREAGEVSVRAREYVRRAQRGVARHLRDAVGERGFNLEGEGYLRMTMTLGLLQFLHGQRTALGQRFGEASGQDWLLVLPLITGIGPEGARPAYGPAGWGGRGQQEERSAAFAMGLSNVPEAYLPAARWWFDRVFGLEGGDGTFNIHLPSQAGFALMNYPFGVEPRNPGEVLPRAVRDRYHEYFAFRNAWGETEEGHASPDDLLAVFYGRGTVRHYVHQASTSPNFRIVGFGQQWADLNRVGVDEEIEGRLWGEVTFAELDEATGSGRVTLDMHRQYRLRAQDAERPEGSPSKALRAVAVDYSGRSGAPGLYAVVDTVEGLTGHTWRLGTAAQPRVEGNRFTVERGGATLTGLVVAPAEAELHPERNALRVRGGHRFFVVMTLQRDTDPPAFTAEGEGLDSRVRVGDRMVWFDGEKLVVE